MRYSISTTAKYGDDSRSRIINDETKRNETHPDEIQRRPLCKEWCWNAKRTALNTTHCSSGVNASHRKVGGRLRDDAWLKKDQLVDKAKN